MRSSLVIASMLWLACADRARAPAPVANRATTPVASPAPDPKCAGDLAVHREVLVRGRPTEIAWGGVRATYQGRSEDLFDDGTSALVLSLEVDGTPWLPDARDTGLHAFGEHCLRVVTSTDDRLELDVALQWAHEYDSGRCHVACCRDHTPGPGGEIECCFCADTP